LSGFFEYRTDHSSSALSPGTVLLGNNGHAYQCGHEHSRGDVSLVFAVKESLLAAVLDCPGSRLSSPEFRLPYLPADPKLSILIARARVAAAERDSFWLEEIAYTLVATALLHDAERGFEESKPSSRDMRRASDVIQFIDKNYMSPLTLTALADIAGVSPFHFLRLFRTVTGTTPYRHVVQLRLREAAVRLLRADDPITDIAFDVGFGDLSQFIRTFRSASGLSPSAFRSAYS
jgi:AraC family transcriptional regulator